MTKEKTLADYFENGKGELIEKTVRARALKSIVYDGSVYQPNDEFMITELHKGYMVADEFVELV